MSKARPITAAIKELRRVADELRESHTVNGEWPEYEVQARFEWLRIMSLIKQAEKELSALKELMENPSAIVDKIGWASLGDDNLAVMLCTYFDTHPNKPNEETDDEQSWTPWVFEKSEEMMLAVANAIAIKDLKNE